MQWRPPAAPWWARRTGWRGRRTAGPGSWPSPPSTSRVTTSSAGTSIRSSRSEDKTWGRLFVYSSDNTFIQSSQLYALSVKDKSLKPDCRVWLTSPRCWVTSPGSASSLPRVTRSTGSVSRSLSAPSMAQRSSSLSRRKTQNFWCEKGEFFFICLKPTASETLLFLNAQPSKIFFVSNVFSFYHYSVSKFSSVGKTNPTETRTKPLKLFALCTNQQ